MEGTPMKDINEDPFILKILKELYKNSKITYKEISEKLGISPVACYNRVQALRNAGVIRKYTIDVDPKKLGYPVKTLIELKVEYSASSKIVERLQNYPHISKIYIISGEKDAIIEAYFRDVEEITPFLKKIREICPEIRETVTHLVLGEGINSEGWW
ncbi:Lrp/AsnC family transcriptional regulator [Thermococcus argininiproducens]|uniref:Lrp/AsnC family transcriptional regulator n=1 Tax=Thermococcus argininiproducens TaxID=2866384 RepID=A0A9E7MAX4_9EURY|nr:Lrp/AsnC family transcriptional regulator [Thermococcus argininiproducens]USG99857.1 Lrp/AsnC family transcriptional regulator [Thermococcus argininiproducens]